MLSRAVAQKSSHRGPDLMKYSCMVKYRTIAPNMRDGMICSTSIWENHSSWVVMVDQGTQNFYHFYHFCRTQEPSFCIRSHMALGSSPLEFSCSSAAQVITDSSSGRTPSRTSGRRQQPLATPGATPGAAPAASSAAMPPAAAAAAALPHYQRAPTPPAQRSDMQTPNSAVGVLEIFCICARVCVCMGA